MDSWARLLDRLPSRAAPATSASLHAFEEKAGFALHPSIRSAWSRADGFVVSGRFRVLSLEQAATYFGAFDGMHMFAFTGDDSDPFCVSCHPALDGRIVRAFHDNAEQCIVAFRSLDDFAASILEVIDVAPVEPDAVPLQYTPKGPRTDDDAIAGRRLLIDAQRLCDESSDWGPRYTNIACGLLSSPDDLAPVLEWPNEYATEHAENRLHALESEAAQTVLRAYEADRVAFADLCARTLESRGFPVVARSKHGGMRIGPAGIWLNMPMFFARRKQPDAMDYLVKRATALMAAKGRP